MFERPCTGLDLLDIMESLRLKFVIRIVEMICDLNYLHVLVLLTLRYLGAYVWYVHLKINVNKYLFHL